MITMMTTQVQAMLLFQMLGVSKMQYVAQLRAPPIDIKKFGLKAQHLFVPGPGSWSPTNFLFES